MEPMGLEYSDYMVISTGDPKEPGGINGGLYEVKRKRKSMPTVVL